MQRTIRLRLNPTIEQSTFLLETLREHTACFNAVAAYGWQHTEKNGVRLHRLHHSKRVVQIYDYVDVHVPVLVRMYEKRVKGYRAMGYSIQG